MAANTGDQSCSAAPGVIDSVCVTPEMLRSTTRHRFRSASCPGGSADQVSDPEDQQGTHTRGGGPARSGGVSLTAARPGR